jgi:hypothetical protein
MNYLIKSISTIFCITLLSTGAVFAGSDMAGHDMSKSDANSDAISERIGELFHESMVDGYMLSYYLMDLREQNTEEAKSHAAHGKKEMDKPHHIMVYIMDKDNEPVLKGKVGFLIKNSDGKKQKAMGMYMSKGFGTTADMKGKGVYAITAKVIVGDVKLMDSFEYEIN